MKILVTGARGFTGRHFTHAATAAGYHVIPLQSNLCDYLALEREIASVMPEAVIHLAAISFVGAANSNAFYEVNIIGSLNLLKALTVLSVVPKKILMASSANVYGNCEGSPISEEALPSPLNHYGASKLGMEYMARVYIDTLPLFFVRPFNYTGQGQNESFLLPKLVAHFASNKNKVELGNLNVAREFNDVRFVCEAYLRLLKQGKSGEIYNICSGISVTLLSVIEQLSQLTNHDLEVKVNPQLIRKNEIQNLYGSPDKLITTVGKINQPILQDTLLWMLAGFGWKGDSEV